MSSIRPLLGLAVAAVACATFSESHRDRWAMVRVENLTVYTNLRDYPEGTVAAFVRARQIIGTLFLDVPGKVEVLLFDEPAAAPGPRLFEYAGQVNVPKPRGIVLSGVQGLDGSRGVIVTLDKPMGSSPLHLMAHRLTGEALPGAPVWLHEGFAMLMDTAWFPRRIGKQQALCFGFRGVTSFRLLPFDELLAADRARAAGTNPWDFAASAFVLVDYLYSGEGGRIRLLMPDLLQALGRGTDLRQALPAALPELSAETLVARYQAHGEMLRDRGRPQCGFYLHDPSRAWNAAAVTKTDLAPADFDAFVARVRQAAEPAGELDWMPAGETR